MMGPSCMSQLTPKRRATAGETLTCSATKVTRALTAHAAPTENIGEPSEHFSLNLLSNQLSPISLILCYLNTFGFSMEGGEVHDVQLQMHCCAGEQTQEPSGVCIAAPATVLWRTAERTVR